MSTGIDINYTFSSCYIKFIYLFIAGMFTCLAVDYNANDTSCWFHGQNSSCSALSVTVLQFSVSTLIIITPDLAQTSAEFSWKIFYLNQGVADLCATLWFVYTNCSWIWRPFIDNHSKYLYFPFLYCWKTARKPGIYFFICLKSRYTIWYAEFAL